MATTTDEIRLFIADDHPAIIDAEQEAFREERRLNVVGTATNGTDALAQIRELKPTVAVVDLRMPGLDGIEIARQLRLREDTAVILFTAFGTKALLHEALDAGVRGYLLKDNPMSDLLRAIYTVAGGGTHVDPHMASLLVGAAADKEDVTPNITPREREILRLLADGKRNEEIGAQLFLSPETVRTHIRKAMRKLDADTRTEAVAQAIRQQFIS